MTLLRNDIIERGALTVVVGSGSSGLAAARLLSRLGAWVRVLDRKEDGFGPDFRREAAENGWELIGGPHTPTQFEGAALVIPSPGVPMKVLEPLLSTAGNPFCLSELELAARFCPESCIAVTGTSGKTTTVSLMAAMLEAAGKKVFLGGNIGTPLSEYVLQREDGRFPGGAADVLVLEVSSFQLQGCREFHPHVAVLLNLSENHLDQHKDMDEYREAKFALFSKQTPGDLAIFGQALLPEAQRRGLAARLATFTDSGAFSKSRLLGGHNRLNMEAAFLAVREYGVTLEQARQAAETFAPMPHRLESVREFDGVLYVNDSKCTTVEAMRVALESFDRPVLLMAGGVFKGGDLQSLRPLLQDKVKAVGLYGASREIFTEAWQGATPLDWHETMSDALNALRAMSTSGDVVLLAPGTSSFDQYANYKERGKDFKKLVEDLQ
ncbi:MAG: UDP-N-acetylmuramoyl-L-alanine--D-glutamate ligase [Deltaproteobacteria bacterium]|jgi:UDP-N-acetylmuramoylalanine--D-glutamate ligase|nr:UDP-N-acetylmuramoyl-L-alanine--D-glutamate ligase [Deltaproteobacteria bacterium]